MPGYSKTPLIKKLGIKEGFKIKLINVPTYYFELLGPFPKTIKITKSSKDLDFIHFFTNRIKELESLLPKFKKQIYPDGMIWVSWYKKSSGKGTEVNEDIIRNTSLAMGMVDVKVCAIDDDWSGLKIVIRKENRS